MEDLLSLILLVVAMFYGSVLVEGILNEGLDLTKILFTILFVIMLVVWFKL